MKAHYAETWKVIYAELHRVSTEEWAGTLVVRGSLRPAEDVFGQETRALLLVETLYNGWHNRVRLDEDGTTTDAGGAQPLTVSESTFKVMEVPAGSEGAAARACVILSTEAHTSAVVWFQGLFDAAFRRLTPEKEK